MTETRELWHNPRCSKSRAAKKFLDAAGLAYTERRYLEDVPTVDEIRDMLTRLRLEPWEITRTGEAAAEELGVTGWPRTDSERDRWIDALARYPGLIQRPIVATGDRAVVARDEQTLRGLQ